MLVSIKLVAIDGFKVLLLDADVRVTEAIVVLLVSVVLLEAIVVVLLEAIVALLEAIVEPIVGGNGRDQRRQDEGRRRRRQRRQLIPLAGWPGRPEGRGPRRERRGVAGWCRRRLAAGSLGGGARGLSLLRRGPRRGARMPCNRL